MDPQCLGVSIIAKTSAHLKNGKPRKPLNVALPIYIKKYLKPTHMSIKNLHLKSVEQKETIDMFTRACSNDGQNIVDKITKSSKINFSMESFRADVLQFSSATVEIFTLGGWLALIYNYKHFRDFLETSQFI